MQNMKNTKSVFSAIVLLGCLGACSSNGTAETPDGGHGVSADAACSGTMLTVKNFEDWCTFEINGTHSSSGPEEAVCVPDGTVNLTATANSGFVLGSKPWNDTTTENGGSATIKVSGAAACVWVCCPGTSGTPACPTTDQCP
jgi:hypothetical protein